MSDQAKASSAKPESAVAVLPEVQKPKMLPPYKVILHNDDVNVMEDVVAAIVVLTPLNKEEAVVRTLEAHTSGCALLLVTHKERAELYAEQFQTMKLVVTIEPEE